MTLLPFGGRMPSLVAAALLWAALPVAAQPPRIPPDARGFQATMIMQQHYQGQATRHATTSPAIPVAPPPRYSAHSLNVDVAVPDTPSSMSGPTTYVTLRGPDGEVRRFPLARGVRVEYRPGPIVLRPGESTTVRLTTLY